MVGMHTSGFDRLVKALDEYAGNRPEAEVVIQSGSGRYVPVHARAFGFKDSLKAEIEQADLVISHGSIGFFDALRLGKRLIVVPRLARFGEIIDDHQVGFAQACSISYGFPVVLEISELAATLDRIASEPAPSAIMVGKPTGLHRELAAYLAGLSPGHDPGLPPGHFPEHFPER